MLKTESRTINGAMYTVTQLPAMRALRLFSRVTGAIAPAIARAAGVAKGGVTIENMDVGAVGDAIGILAEKLHPDELEAVTRELLWNFTRDGKPLGLETPQGRGAFDLELAGDVMTILALLKFAFEVNYGNFSGAVTAMLQKAGTATPAPKA